MSPEQALGQPNLDGRSDLYAFGAMLFQMVTGAPPYDGNSSAEIVGKHLADPIPIASDVNARIPRWLSDAIVKCLAKQPEGRFQTADEALAALRRGPTAGSAKLVDAATVERRVRPGNPPIGEALEGPPPAFQRLRGRRVAPIVPGVGGQSYFAPLVTNTTATDITIEVNPGTQAAVRCNCLVPKGAVRTHIGYYRLYRNSTIAAYNNAHPYLGPHVDREGFAPRLALRSGAVVLVF